MLTPAEADHLIRENITLFPREDCPLSRAHGRVLRTDIAADRDLPPFDRVTLDGFAVRASALAAGVTTFRVDGVQAAGMRAFKLGTEPDRCVEIMTGAVLPDGADCVVPYEEATREGATMRISPAAAAFAAGHAVHRRGSDHRAGDVIVRAGTRLTGREIAVAAACGAATVTVSQLPRIAIIASGDELVEVESGVAAHQIRRSNDYAIRAALAAAGFPKALRFHARDVQHEIQQLLAQVIAEADVIIVIGGISKGKFDYLPAELDRQKVRRLFQGVAQRPGKPLWFGRTAKDTPVFALPGNPVSAYTCVHRYVLPALDQASGARRTEPRQVALAAPVTFQRKLTYFLPVKLGSGPRAELQATPDPSNTSGDFAGLVGTDGFVELPAEREDFPAGTVVPFWAWV